MHLILRFQRGIAQLCILRHCAVREKETLFLRRPRSPVGLQLCRGARDANLAPELSQARVSRGRY